MSNIFRTALLTSKVKQEEPEESGKSIANEIMADEEFSKLKRKLEQTEPELHECKRRLQEAEKKLEQFECLKTFVTANGMQLRRDKPTRARITLPLPNFADLAAQPKGFKVDSVPIDSVGFKWDLRADRFAKEACMGVTLSAHSPAIYTGRFQFDLDCSFRISNTHSLSKDVHKEKSAAVIGKFPKMGSLCCAEFAEIQKLTDPTTGFLREDGSIQIEVDFIVKSATLDQFFGEQDVKNNDEMEKH